MEKLLYSLGGRYPFLFEILVEECAGGISRVFKTLESLTFLYR